MKFFAPTSLWRFAGAEFSAIAASGPRARVCDVTGCETFWLGSSAEFFSFWAAAREIDPTSRATRHSRGHDAGPEALAASLVSLTGYPVPTVTATWAR